MDIKINAATFQLLPNKAVFWLEQRCLIIADCHFGKEAIFQHFAIPVPYGATRTDLQRIDNLIKNTCATKIIFLGDFFHGFVKDKLLLSEIANWRQHHNSIIMQLIVGNHDKHMPFLKEVLPMEIVKEIIIDNFLLTHEPIMHQNYFNIAGHVHPVFNLMYGRCSERLPCFYQSATQLILPSFGTFTGGYLVKKTNNTHIYLISSNKVFSLSY